MPPVRKRKASTSLDDDDPSSSNVLVIKRNRLVVKSQLSACREIFATLRNERLEDGSLLCEPFLRVPKRKAEPDYYDTVTTPMDLSMIQQKLKNEEYNDVEQMSCDIQLIVSNAKAVYGSDSAEYQQADALWELFLELKTTTAGEYSGPAAGDDEDDEDSSRMSSVTDETASRDETRPLADIEVTGSGLKVPVLKLKVGAGGYVEGSAVIGEVNDTLNMTTQSNDCSSDFDAASENQSVSTMHSRLSSSSELDDQASSELVVKLEKTAVKHWQATMGLRERRYAYRDFITPKQTRKKQSHDGANSARESPAETTGNDEPSESAFEQLFTAVATATDGDRLLCQPFKVLPCRTKYIDYYQVIREPIDLRTIAQKIQSQSYETLESMYKDLMLMIQNARYFNKPSSLIYKDAVALRKVISARKNELEMSSKSGSQVTPAARVQRARTRCSGAGVVVSGQSLVSEIATLPDDPADEEKTAVECGSEAHSELANVSSRPETADHNSDADGSESSEEPSELWSLFKTVRSYTTNLGLCLAEPFLRLPSKRIYADYYLEIKKPISMMKIRKKLKNDRYSDLDALAADFNLLFDNAKQYNREESKIYKDAVKLQTIMMLKKTELQRAAKESWEAASNQSLTTTPDTSVASTEDVGQKKKRSRSITSEDSLKKRLMLIFNFINDYQFDSRRLIDIFVTLPSKKDYPDYYKVISEPIDMSTIESKIKSDKYSSQQALVDDIELMFKNARNYNEENSQVYKDADTLERLLHSRVRTLAPIDDSSKSQQRSAGRPKSKAAITLAGKLQDLYNTVRDYTDSHGRTLSTPYMKLPPKSEYPDYYEVIRRPIDMQKVLQRMMASQYQNIDDMVADFVLMFDNACKYNEPESLIYKDALTLQRVCLSKKSELVDESDESVPDVSALVQELMRNVFVSTFSHTDEEGRCFTDSFLELPAAAAVDDTDESKKITRFPCNFEQIKRNLDKGRYKRFDRFQEDVFEVFEYARKVSSVDSQVYEDSVELQLFFMKQRDELCRRGEVLLTPALNYTVQQLTSNIDDKRREQTSREQQDDDDRKRHAASAAVVKASSAQETSVESYEYNGVVYRVGDFVYVEQRDKEKGNVPHIVSCERLMINQDGEHGLYGCWFLRPNETFHLATRKFLQKEVFKSDFYDTTPFHKVLGKCCVLFVKEYFKYKPEGFADEDVFVCESRYSGKSKSFKKIKIWQPAKSDHVNLVARTEALTPVRVTSVFAVEPGVVADDGQTGLLDKSREVVLVDDVLVNDGCTYYEQMCVAAGWIKLDDAVYLSSGDEHLQIIRIDKLWTNSNGEAFIHGPCFVSPAQVDHVPTRLFYKKEVIRSSREQTIPALSIVGRCAVLSYKEYCTSRFTEIAENDVFVCECKCDDKDKVIKKFNKPLKRISLSEAVCEDEVYFFKKPIVPHKELSPLLPKALDISVANEESMDGPSSVDQSLNDTSSYQGDSVADNTPTSSKKKKLKDKAANKVRQISGYIVFAAECRKDIQAEYPGCNFGEISRIVGNKWKALPKDIKDRYEERARVIAKKTSETSLSMSEAALYAGDSCSMSPYPATHLTASGPNGMPVMFSPQHCMPPMYALNSPYQAVGPSFPPTPYNTQAVCFPNGFQAGQQMTGATGAPAMSPAPPLFVTVPPRTQKVVHSETYLRYIEGLTSGSRSVGGWEKSLYAKPPDNAAAVPVSDKLPVHWLADGNEENAVSALWALRDHMLRDAITISRTLDSA